jgi:CheY-like chemotaxis protein
MSVWRSLQRAIGAVPVVPGESLSRAQTLLESARTLVQGRSVLWVDDNPENNEFETALLRRYGVHVDPVRSTKEALAFLSRGPCDLIISDVSRVEEGVSRPGAGYDLLDALGTSGPRIPLIFYTGAVTRIDVTRARAALGAADDVGNLVNLIVHALTRADR